VLGLCHHKILLLAITLINKDGHDICDRLGIAK